MRIGLMVGSDKERPSADRLAGLVADGAAAENGGFSTFWMPQVPGYLDAMTAVTLIGQATDRIEIGTAVVPIQTRHPLIMAQQALTTQIACGGRFTLGIGPSHHWIINGQLGLDYEHPARRASATTSTCSMRRSPDRGMSTSTTAAFPSIRRWMSRDIYDVPILLSALGPAMLRLAGRTGRWHGALDGGRAGDQRPRRPAHH